MKLKRISNMEQNDFYAVVELLMGSFRFGRNFRVQFHDYLPSQFTSMGREHPVDFTDR